MPFLDGKPVIITKRNTDKYNNPISVKQIETKQVMDILNCIPVNYSIDRNYPINIAGLHQIYNQDEITETTFFADYDQGILYFHPKLVGKSLNISYMGTGYILISSNRIYRYNKSDSTAGTIEASFEKIETLMQEILSGKVTADNISAEVIGARTDKGGQTYNSLGDRLNAIDGEISSIGADILRYRNKVDIPGNTNTVNIGITEYDSSTDLLFVYLSGVRMLEGVDYNVDIGGLTISCIHPMQWVKGDQIYFEVLKKGRNIVSTNPGGQYLPLTGGIVAGDVFVNGGLSTLTPQPTDNSDKVATTEFVKTAVDNKEDAKSTMVENYTSIISSKINEYSYSELVTDINALVSKYSSLLTLEVIGQSVLNRDIKAIILGNPNAKNKALIFSGHHAREQHMATVILKQIEYYCENMNNKFDGERMEDIFKNSALFFIPTINPDGLELCRIGIDSVPGGDTARIQNIKNALETKIRTNLLKNKDITETTDLNVQWSGDKGTVPGYTFRNKDMHMWKANANGVDLHYNCWDSTNETDIKALASSSNFPSSFASENYIGSVGMNEPENIALKNFMDKYNLWTYTLSYHGKGPTSFWNYRLKGKQAQRNHRITKELCNHSNTVYSEINNSKVGFAGYMFSNSKANSITYSAIRETGWGNERINADNNYNDNSSPPIVCPLDNWQLPYIWKAEKEIPLLFLKRYVRRQDLKIREINLSEYDFSYTPSNNNINGEYTNQYGICEKWGVITVPFNGETSKTVTIDLPFTNVNMGGFANCVNINDSILSKINNVSVSRDKVNQSIITINATSPLGSVSSTYSVGINYLIRGI